MLMLPATAPSDPRGRKTLAVTRARRDLEVAKRRLDVLRDEVQLRALAGKQPESALRPLVAAQVGSLVVLRDALRQWLLAQRQLESHGPSEPPEQGLTKA